MLMISTVYHPGLFDVSVSLLNIDVNSLSHTVCNKIKLLNAGKIKLFLLEFALNMGD